MSELESLSPGAKANMDFINNLRQTHPELEEHVPDNCKDCSTAWLFALRGRGEEQLLVCLGRGITEAGSLAVMACRINENQTL